MSIKFPDLLSEVLADFVDKIEKEKIQRAELDRLFREGVLKKETEETRIRRSPVKVDVGSCDPKSIS